MDLVRQSVWVKDLFSLTKQNKRIQHISMTKEITLITKIECFTKRQIRKLDIGTATKVLKDAEYKMINQATVSL